MRPFRLLLRAQHRLRFDLEVDLLAGQAQDRRVGADTEVEAVDLAGRCEPGPGAAGTSISTGQPLAVISWHDALHALEDGFLPCASSEQAVLRIAASLGDPAIPVHLRAVLGNLDPRNITLVTDAITAANG